MKKSPFTGCCGIDILYDFGGTNMTLGNISTKTSEEIESFLMCETRKSSDGYMRKAGLLVALNEEQYLIYKESFAKLGWKVLEQFHHPAHNSEIFLLSKKLFT